MASLLLHLVRRAPAPQAPPKLPQGPPVTLTAEAMGRRLELGIVDADGNRQALDRETGARWSVRVFPTADQAGLAVAAGALYRLVGVAAPAARLVDFDGRRRAIAWPALTAWRPWRGELLARHGAAAAAELPADVWIGNTRIPDAIRARTWEIPDTATLIRWDLSGCLAYRATGRPDTSFQPTDVPELAQALELEGYQAARDALELLGPMAERVGKVSEAEIMDALALGALAPERAAILGAALVARRSLVRLRVQALISGARRSR